MNTAARNNVHFILYRYCCKGRYFVNIHLKCWGKVGEFDHDWRVATLGDSATEDHGGFGHVLYIQTDEMSVFCHIR